MIKTVINSIQPDENGRIELGELAKGITSFRVILDDNHRIILEPENIPEHEKWLYENQEALEGVLRGIDDAKAGRVSPAQEDFSHYMDAED